MVTQTVYVNVSVWCYIVNCLNGSLTLEWAESFKEVSLKKTRKFPYEIQIPIQIISQFTKKNRTKINLYKLQQLTR